MRTIDPHPTEEVPLLSQLMAKTLPKSVGRRCMLLWSESLLYSGIWLYAAAVLGIKHYGTVSVFLAAAALTERFKALLAENRDNIWIHQVSSRRANALTVASLAFIFFGTLTTYVLAAATLEEQTVRASFTFVFDSGVLGRDTILTRHFADTWQILSHNALVCVTFFSLAFLYWFYGALLAITWNACTFGILLTMLIERGMHFSSLNSGVYVLAATLTMLPHLLCELVAYIGVSLAGIFMSKALSKYRPSDPRFRGVMGAVFKLLVVAGICIAIGAFIESSLVPLILRTLAPVPV